MAKKNSKNKFKFKWTKELIFLIVGLCAIIVATIVLAIPSSASKRTAVYNDAISSYNTANSSSYTTLSDENIYSYISDIDEMISKINSTEDYVYIYYGALSDGTTLSNLSAVDTAARDNEEIDTVYFFEASWVIDNSNDTEEYKTELTNNNKKFNDNEKFTLATYPTLLVYHNKQLVFCTQDYDDNTSYNWTIYINQAFNVNKQANN